MTQVCYYYEISVLKIIIFFKKVIDIFKDEECLRPGEASDLTFLDKMEKTIGEHAHFVRYGCKIVIEGMGA